MVFWEDTKGSLGGNAYTVHELYFKCHSLFATVMLMLVWIMPLWCAVTGLALIVRLLVGMEGVRWEDSCKQVIATFFCKLYIHGG